MSFRQNIPGELQLKGKPINAQDGAQLSGTYDTSLTVNGDATITGDMVVNGDLIVAGALVNSGGHSLVVNGDLVVNYQMNFNPSSPSVVQGNLTVYGDMILSNKAVAHHLAGIQATGNDPGTGIITAFDLGAAGVPSDDSATVTMTSGAESGHSGIFFWADIGGGLFELILDGGNIVPDNVVNGDTFSIDWAQTASSAFNVNPGQSPMVDVRGNCIGSLDGTGNIGANGMNFSVRGLAVGNFPMHGGNADASHPAGNGGTGNFFGGLIGGSSANGGSSDQAAHDAGNGGSISVSGLWSGNAECSGGDGSNGANGGNGGSFQVAADCSPQNNLYLQGGQCIGGGGAPTHGAGDGGNVTVFGDALNFIRVPGGNVSGNFSNAAASVIHAGNAGSITVIGSFIHEFNTNSYVDANGGTDAGCTSANAIVIQCGNGGTVVVNGDMAPDIQGVQLSGGGHFTSPTLKVNGGNGGSLAVYGTCSALANDLFSQMHLDGGAGANGGTGGNGGIAVLKAGYATTLSLNGGASDAGQPAGKAGTAVLGPNFSVKTLLSALDGTTGTAATGGAQVTLSGYCAIRTLSLANRSDAHINGDAEAMLQVGTLTDKKTLWNGTAESADQSGATADSIFKWDVVSALWYKITGTSL